MTAAPSVAGRWRRDPRVLWRAIGDSLVILPPERPDAVAVSGSAGRLWELLAEARSVAELIEALAASYRQEPSVIAESVTETVRVLAESGAVVPASERREPTSEAPGGPTDLEGRR